MDTTTNIEDDSRNNEEGLVEWKYWMFPRGIYVSHALTS
jgi:hypothetical protein